MKSAKNYILRQVASGKLPKERAAKLLLDLNGNSDKEKRDIAIIGIAARFPKAGDVNEFWENIKNKVNCIDIPAAKRREVMIPVYRKLFNAEEIEESRYEPGGYLDDVDSFDADFFGISKKEALLMNPLQRIMLEAVYLAVENAGLSRERIAETDTGVFIGRDNASTTLYNEYVGNIHPLALTGAYAAVLSSRISHVLKITGPSMVFDTACSSALVSVHYACEALRSGECGMAIAGGINLKDNLVKTDDNPMDKIVSEDVKIRTFDKAAKGTLLSEGVGVVVLKPLYKALADGDNIHAVIKGSSVNNDGGSTRIATPRAETQAEVLTEAWENAGISPETISYIETHGIGTYLGDPIEIRAIKQAFEGYTQKKQFCAVSAVKTNIGHTVAASGMASLLKAVMALKSKKIPPLINFEESNPHIDFPGSPVYVCDSLKEWDKGKSPRRCGVNSFGFGGTNCHIVLEEASELKRSCPGTRTGKMLFALSAMSGEALKELVLRYRLFLKDSNLSLQDICYTSCTGRDHYEYRIIMAAESLEDLKYKLDYIYNQGLEELNLDFVYYGEHKAGKNRKKEKAVGDITCESITEETMRDVCLLYTEGADIDWEGFYKNIGAGRVSLPAYPLERRSFWYKEDDHGLFKVKRKRQAGEKSEAVDKIRLVGRDSGVYTKTEQDLALIWGNELGIKQINVDENYFELGGDSISGIKIVNAVNSKTDMKASLTELLKYPSISCLAKHLEAKAEQENGESLTIRPAGVREYYPLSSAQMRIFIHNRFIGGTAYNLPRVFLIEGRYDRERINDALRTIVKRHDTLRTSFHLVHGEYVQKINENTDFGVEYVKAEGNSFNEEHLKDFVRPFDLSEAPLFRARLLSFSETSCALLMDMHHIISDRASMIILLKEFADLYEGRQLPDLKIQYKDYVVWLGDFIKSEDLKKQEEYWLKVYSDKIPPVRLWTDYNKSSAENLKEKLEVYKFDRDFKSRLVKFGSSAGATLNMILFSAYCILLRKWMGYEDTAVGISILGRNYRELENIVGMFVNTLAVRGYPNGNKTFQTFLMETKEALVNAYENQEYPYEILVGKLKEKFNKNINTLFGTMFIMQNMKYSQLEIKGLKVVPHYIPANTRFDLQLDVFETDEDNLSLCFTYSDELYKEETVRMLLRAYIDILSQGIAHPGKKLDELEVNLHG